MNVEETDRGRSVGGGRFMSGGEAVSEREVRQLPNGTTIRSGRRRTPVGEDFEEWMKATFGEDRDFFPVDLDAIAAGDLELPSPGFLRRADGHKLLYPGMLHWLASEPEAGKSWLALIAVKELLEAGRKVVYFDYEMSPQDVVRRLFQLGLAPRRNLRKLEYIRPPGKMPDDILQFYGTSTEGAPALFKDVALVVFDACTEAMAADGLDPLDNVQVAKWLQRAPRLALRMGAAVLVLDHVPKDRENRGRYALGAQHKLAQTDVQYALYNTQPFAPGRTGLSAIVVQKDRPGGVRARALDGRKVGSLVLNAEDPDVLEGFIASPKEDEGPTERMAEILAFAQSSAVPLSKNQLESVGGGRTTTNRSAVTRLIAVGQLVPAPEDEGRRHPRYVGADAVAKRKVAKPRATKPSATKRPTAGRSTKIAVKKKTAVKKSTTTRTTTARQPEKASTRRKKM